MSEKKTAKDLVKESVGEGSSIEQLLKDSLAPRDLAVEGWVRQTRDYAVVTPLFGGGAVAGQPDVDFPVNGKGVRGQLRFWWRVMRGGQFNGDLAEMRKREAEIWGTSAGNDSAEGDEKAVQIVVGVLNVGTEYQPYQEDGRINRNWKDVAYFAFPLQPQNNPPKPPGKVREGVEYRLHISYQQCWEQEVAAALWAWEMFGGVGARVRRGFGSIYCFAHDGREINLPTAEKFREEFLGKLGVFITPGPWPEGIPHLSRYRLSRAFDGNNTHDDVWCAWNYVARQMKEFRQHRRPGRQENRPGRSYWPEAEYIRRLTNQRRPVHTALPNPVDAFPRYAFGAPVIFKFQDNSTNSEVAHVNPRSTTLVPQECERWASPLIVRPIPLYNRQSVAIAIVFQYGGALPGAVLEDAPHTPSVRTALTAAEAALIPKLTVNGNAFTNVLDAFLESL